VAGELLDVAAVAGTGVGGGLGALGAFRFIRWGIEHFGKRQDARQLQLDAQQERVDTSLAKRLSHLEAQELANRDRIQVLEEVTTTLIAELRSIDPNNPKLHDVAHALRMSIPFAPPSPSIDESIDKLRGVR
jgi:hypothetical protein